MFYRGRIGVRGFERWGFAVVSGREFLTAALNPKIPSLKLVASVLLSDQCLVHVCGELSDSQALCAVLYRFVDFIVYTVAYQVTLGCCMSHIKIISQSTVSTSYNHV